MTVRPLLGQTVEDFERVNDRLRTSVGATRARVDLRPPNDVLLTFAVGDTLAEPFKAREPALTTDPLPSHVWMGRCEDGTDWRLPLGPHTLVAGCSGSGKGSVLWSLAFGLAPWVKTGLVRLHGIDLKGGMEILMGADLFSTCATTPAEAVAVLEQLVAEMQARTKKYAGRVRSHTATEEEPLNVVLIDELAALTAYCPERDLQRRAEMAINMLCSQGRAPGLHRLRVPAGPPQGGHPLPRTLHADGRAATQGHDRDRDGAGGRGPGLRSALPSDHPGDAGDGLHLSRGGRISGSRSRRTRQRPGHSLGGGGIRVAVPPGRDRPRPHCG